MGHAREAGGPAVNFAPMSDASFVDPIALLDASFRGAIARAFPQAADAEPLITASKQIAIADFQSNAAMGLAKRVGKQPREVAAAIVAEAAKDTALASIAEPLTEKSIAGPGFINVKLRGEAIAGLVASMDSAALGVAPVATPLRVVVDLMGVNLAKQMHVGHLRSPFVGDAIARVLERLGHTVIRQNHVGDWGLNIAMVTARLMKLAKLPAGDPRRVDLERLTLDGLDAAYKAAQAACQRDLAGLEACKKFGLGPKATAECEEQVNGATEAFLDARQVLVKLQSHDAETYGVWKRIQKITMDVCLAVCKRLHVNVTDEHSAGESTYAEELVPMVADLEKRGIAELDQGALVVRVDAPEFGGIKEPCLVRKTDGGFLYATTDIAGIRRRVQTMHADRLVYVIDARQNLHLRQCFGAASKAGYATNPKTGKVAIMEHAAFGSVLGEDGRPFKTRSGENVNLQSLIDEAVERASAGIRARAKEGDAMSDGEVKTLAESLGVAAMKYADLCNDRVKDYVFSFDRMLAFEGNTGPYLLYALVRIKSIFRKAKERGVSVEGGVISIAQPQEKMLALALLKYPGALKATGDACEPHRLCTYLYELAGAFSSFFDACPVLAAPDEATMRARLRLCELTGKVLEDGLKTLGIPVVERM